MDLKDLLMLQAQYYNMVHRYGEKDLRTAAARSLWEDGINKGWLRFKKAAQDAGYKRLHLGSRRMLASHAEARCDIYAEPPRRIVEDGEERSALSDGMCTPLGGAVYYLLQDHGDCAVLALPVSACQKFMGEHVLTPS